MIQFHIEAPDKGLEAALQDKIDNLTKPKGSLGTLEALALQVGLIQQTLSPVLRHPVNVIYASDHGIADEGVSKSPKEVTRQVIHNFLNGGAGVCYLARQHGFELKIVDGGVDFDFPVIPQLIDRKVRKGGTRNNPSRYRLRIEGLSPFPPRSWPPREESYGFLPCAPCGR